MFKKAIPFSVALALALSATVSPFAVEAQQGRPKSNLEWWPKSVDLRQLRWNETNANPAGADYNYAADFAKLDLDALKTDLKTLMRTSQEWWPADYGHYGPFFIRMTWHAAGTYRTFDGRGGADGGQQRFAPLNSWPDNGNLDKARRLLWPLKKKYGNTVSWSDLITLAGTLAMEDMGFPTYGFAFGRSDDWMAELVYWGPENVMLDDKRYEGERELKKPLGAVQMGLIYVNPEGPNGNPDPKKSAFDVRDTFARMAMNDEETVALVAGGHTFGKMHGAHKGGDCGMGAAPEGTPVEDQGLGWKHNCGSGKGNDTVTSGFEGPWTQLPTTWTSLYFENLLSFEWEKVHSPGGPIQWVPKGAPDEAQTATAHDADKTQSIVMTTADLSLREDPAYRKISESFRADHAKFEDAFGRAWYKLTHRDLGPRARYLGSDVPEEVLIWQDHVEAPDYKLVTTKDVKKLKKDILKAGISHADLVQAAWASAASYRATDMRGGTNGGRVRLDPQINWAANNPAQLKKTLAALEEVRAAFNKKSKSKQISAADIIVLGGAAAIEDAAKKAGMDISVPFTPGRGDATAAQTDVASFGWLEPQADAFRNYYSAGSYLAPADAMVDTADKLDLTVAEMTVLLGGLRVLGNNTDGSAHGVFTDKPGQLSNDFFVNLLDMRTKWSKAGDHAFVGHDRITGEKKWTATTVDLVFGSNSELRAVAEYYAIDGAEETFAKDFVKAWTKVMNNGRF